MSADDDFVVGIEQDRLVQHGEPEPGQGVRVAAVDNQVVETARQAADARTALWSPAAQARAQNQSMASPTSHHHARVSPFVIIDIHIVMTGPSHELQLL